MADNRSWLEGPQVPGQYDNPDKLSTYAGENLGLQKTGPGSIASLGRRIGALLLDWVVCMVITGLLFVPFGPSGEQLDRFGGDTYMAFQNFSAIWTLPIFIIIGSLSVIFFSRTPGHMMLGMGVARVDQPDQGVGIWRPIVRTVLTAFVLPPVVQDADGRGMHDRATGTVVIRG